MHASICEEHEPASAISGAHIRIPYDANSDRARLASMRTSWNRWTM